MSSARTKVTFAGKYYIRHEDSPQGLLELYEFALNDWTAGINNPMKTTFGLRSCVVDNKRYDTVAELEAKIAELRKAAVLDELRQVIDE